MSLNNSPSRSDRLSLLTSIAIALWMVVLTLAPHSAYRPLHIVFHYGLLPVLLGIFCYIRWREIGTPLFRCFSWPDLSMVLYIALTLVSYFWANKTGSPGLHFFAVFRNIFVPFSVFWVIRISRFGSRQIGILVPVMTLLTVINIFVSLLAWFKPEYLPSIWPALLSDIGEIRITGTFTNADIFAGAVMLFSSFILQDTTIRKNGPYRLLLMSIYSLSIVCIWLTFSRTSWISLVFLLLITGVLYRKSFVRLDLISLVPSLLLLIVTFAIPPTILREQKKVTPEVTALPMDQANTLRMVYERIASSSQIRSRILTGYAGLRMFAEKPILGWGYETYILHAKKFVAPIGSWKISEYESQRAPSHNTFITILAETGVLGLFLYTFPLAWWGLSAVRNRHLYMESRHNKSFLNFRFFIVLWANLALILLISQSIDIRFFPFTLVQIWFILGLISNLIQPDSES
jgi:O-antigen ligase